MLHNFLEPWVSATNRSVIMTELQKEINQQHPLFEKRVELVGRSLQSDDYLFKIAFEDFAYCVVHLTWLGRRETNSAFPSVTFYTNWEEFTEKVMHPQHQHYRQE